MMAEDVRIYFVGAGPGDPELLTVKGRRLLGEADIVVYAGSLVADKLLLYCAENVKVYNSASMTLGEITEVMIEGARAGRLVVRLHTGDTAFYSAMREQAAILKDEGLAYTVVPGVSSASGAAASIGRELTVPVETQTVIFTRLAGRTPVPEDEALHLLASHRATMCIFLSVSMIDKVVEQLLQGGYPTDTPVAVVYRATWPDELTVRGTLQDIASRVQEAGIKKHAIILVGKAIGGIGDGEQSFLYDAGFSHEYRGE
ncbi:MAG: precorrin-4 C(11)-methyltransferase [Thermodesulfobacteriota bacterium]